MRMTVVIPALNEAGNIGRLVEEAYGAIPASILGELIVVDDGSDDSTPDEVMGLIASGRHPGLRLLRHARRCGQSTAIRSGILAASHPVIGTLDGDGQNDPADLPRLIAKLGSPGGTGPALVGGVRVNRKAEGSKRLASKAANWIRDAVLRDRCPDTGCGTKVFHRDAFLRLPFFTSLHRYLPAFFITYGHEVAYEPVNDRPRTVGKSKYSNLVRALVGLYDLFGVSWLRRRTRVPEVVEPATSAAAAARGEA
ncbi:MAG: glycosyltransferase [Rhizobiales bacterium]|nr:glycosyltransferase [Hyphomicrobiales bacterium]